MANLTTIIPPRVPIMDPKTGIISREWYLFFLNLFALAGSGSNDVSLTDLQINPSTDTIVLAQLVEMCKRLNALEAAPRTEIAEMSKRIEAFEMNPVVNPDPRIDELTKRVETLEAEVAALMAP